MSMSLIVGCVIPGTDRTLDSGGSNGESGDADPSWRVVGDGELLGAYPSPDFGVEQCVGFEAVVVSDDVTLATWLDALGGATLSSDIDWLAEVAVGAQLACRNMGRSIEVVNVSAISDGSLEVKYNVIQEYVQAGVESIAWSVMAVTGNAWEDVIVEVAYSDETMP
jgi:hypothetical protein